MIDLSYHIKGKNKMSKSWDNGIVKKLKTLMGRGLSTAEIGKKLGLSKNAVVGKLHRMGWTPKAVEDDKKSENKKVTVKKTATDKKSATKTEAKKVVEKKVAPVKKVAVVAKPAKKKTGAADKPGKSVAVKTQKVEKKPAQKSVQKPVVKVAQKTEPKQESKVEAKPVVGRPIAGRGGTAHQRIVQHALEMAELKPNQCRWPIGDPDSEGFHFCGKPVFVGKPYCYEHCKMAYQFTPPKKK